MSSEGKSECPSCKTSLQELKTTHGVLHRCPLCHGHAVPFGYLRSISSPDAAQRFWKASMNAPDSNKKLCPQCKKIMKSIQAGNPKVQMELDVCTPCVLIWFDRSELERLVSAKENGSHQQKPPLSGTAPSAIPEGNDSVSDIWEGLEDLIENIIFFGD